MRTNKFLWWLVVIGCLVIAAGIVILSQTVRREEDILRASVNEEIMIPVIFRLDPSTGIADNATFVNEFNEAFDGQYYMSVDWLAESAGGYRNKLKQWNVLDEMPVLISDAGFDNDFYEVLIKDHRLVDLRPYMETSEFWMDVMNEDILADCTEDDGSIYLSPLASNLESFAGIIYNEDLLKQAGYDGIPKTWDEFFECLDALKNKGITPLALHGSGSYWVPMLFATAYLSGTEEGRIFLGEDFPQTYQKKCMEEMFLMMKKLYSYTFPDAVEIDFDTAGSRFINGEAAIIANGMWMFSSMKAHDEMRFAMFPQQILMNSPRMSAWAVTAGHSEEVTLGAVKALEFRIQSEQETLRKMLEEKSDTQLEADYVEMAQKVEIIMPNYQMKWEQELQNEFFTENIPLFLNGTISVERLLEMMDRKVAEIENRK